MTDQSTLWEDPTKDDAEVKVGKSYKPITRAEWVARTATPKGYHNAEVCSITKRGNGYVLAFDVESEKTGDCFTFYSCYLSKRQINNLVKALREFLKEAGNE